jgi:hypothetical protein
MPLRSFTICTITSLGLFAQTPANGGISIGTFISSRSYGIDASIHFTTPLNIAPRFGVQTYRILPRFDVASNLCTSFSIGLGFPKNIYLDYEKLSEPKNYPKSFGDGYGIKLGAGYNIESDYLPLSIGGFVAHRSGNSYSQFEAGLKLSYTFPF